MSTPSPANRRPLSARQNKNAGASGTSGGPSQRNTSGTARLGSPAKPTSNGTVTAGTKIANLESQNAQLSRQLSDLTQDTERTEQALVERDVLLERTRERVKVLERESTGWSKRIEQQEQGFDLEREQWTVAEEQNTTKLERLEREKKRLREQVDQLQAEREGEAINPDQTDKADLRPTTPLPHAELTRLAESLSTTQTTLSSLQKAHLELEHRLARSESTLKEEKEINERLREENEVWEKLVGTRTIEGTIGIGLGIGFGSQSKIEQGTVRSTAGRSTRRERGKSLADELGGFDLEAFAKGEMEGTRKEVQVQGNAEMDNMREENEELRLELKQMSEANRGLRLYCSKILDRILSHADSEQFLADVSSDPATSRKIPVRPGRQRQASNRSRPQSVLYSSNSEDRVAQVDPKTGLRPLSMLAGRNEPTSPEPQKAETEGASEKRTRRGLSLNWGSFAGFGGGSGGTPSPRTETGPSVPEPRTGSVSPAPIQGGRKLQTHEEDDEDRVERERLAATMKLMGVDAAGPSESHTLLSPTVPGQGMQRSNSAQSNVSAASSHDNARPAKPSRWSSFFGRATSAEPASIEPATPAVVTPVGSPPLGDLADTIKLAQAQRRKEERESLKNNTHLTEAPKSVTDIIASTTAHHKAKKSVDSMGSLEEMRRPMTMQDDSEREAEHKPKGSISTLFDVSVHDA